jgi:hypothetical protein
MSCGLCLALYLSYQPYVDANEPATVLSIAGTTNPGVGPQKGNYLTRSHLATCSYLSKGPVSKTIVMGMGHGIGSTDIGAGLMQVDYVMLEQSLCFTYQALDH